MQYKVRIICLIVSSMIFGACILGIALELKGADMFLPLGTIATVIGASALLDTKAVAENIAQLHKKEKLCGTQKKKERPT